MNALSVVDSEESFDKAVRKFNNEHHQYQYDDFIRTKPDFFDSENFVNLDNEYFDRFFSDWIFIKNGSDEDIEFKTRNNEYVIVKPNEVRRFNFGRTYEENN